MGCQPGDYRWPLRRFVWLYMGCVITLQENKTRFVYISITQHRTGHLAQKKDTEHIFLFSNQACNVNKIINVHVYSLISHRVQQTSQFTPLVLELSLVRSHLPWGEFSAFSAAIAIHNSPLFVPPRYPSLLGEERRHMKGLPNTSGYGHQRDSSTGHPSKY